MKNSNRSDQSHNAWSLFAYYVRRYIDWLFRGQSVGRNMIRAGTLILMAVGGSPLLTLVLSLVLGFVPQQYREFQQTVDASNMLIPAFGCLLIFTGIVLEVMQSREEANARSKKRVVVFEARGLRNDDGSPLLDAIPQEIVGLRIPVLLDLRNNLDGKVIEPERALKSIVAAHGSLLQHQNGADRSDLTTVYGGLTSVPYTFLTGLLFDDEGRVETYDWDRTQENWRALDVSDDNKGFHLTGIDGTASLKEVVLAVEFSYPVADADLQTTFSHPVVRLTLEGLASDAHWSAQKQSRLALQFLETVKSLSARGVLKIHLVLAAPNSVVVTFGRRYDKRNLPEVIVYQFERGKSPAYPWGVAMPVSGADSPSVIHT
jgi:hypothetical protein